MDTYEFPASYSQELMWFADQMNPGDATHNVVSLHRLRGPLDVKALRRAVDRLVGHHAALRTTFEMRDTDLLQIVLDDLPATFEFRELAQDDEISAAARARDWHFDMARGPLFHVELVRLGCDDHILTLIIHHSISDGWSLALLLRDLGTAYDDLTAGNAVTRLPEPALQFADFAVHQRRWFEDSGSSEEGFWRRTLDAITSETTLPFAREGARVSHGRAGQLSFVVASNLRTSLETAARRHSVTPFVFLISAYQALLHRYTGHSPIVIGTPFSCRTYRETEGVIGFFANNLVLASELDNGASFSALLRQVQDAMFNALENGEFPLSKLILKPANKSRREFLPVFRYWFAFQNHPLAALRLSGIDSRPSSVPRRQAWNDLAVEVLPAADAWNVTFTYNTEIFERFHIDQLMRRYAHWLEMLVTDSALPTTIGEFPLLDESDRRRIVFEWNATEATIPEGCVYDYFKRQVIHTPDASALISSERVVSYGELSALSDVLADVLEQRGIGPGMLVGICAERSVEAIAGVIAVLKTGAAYVPLDPAYPLARLSFMIQDAAPSVILADRAGIAALPLKSSVISLTDATSRAVTADSDRIRPPADTRRRPTPEDAAFVVYTSGSTGQPKGVVNTHRGLLNRLCWQWREFPSEPDDLVCQKTSLSFVDGTTEFLGPLISGVPILIANAEDGRNPAALAALIAAHRVTRLTAVPTLLESLLDHSGCLDSLRICISSGETLPRDLAVRFRTSLPRARLLNFYGSSEVNGDCTWHEVLADGPVLVGRPIANMSIYVLDRLLQPVPIGVTGDLFVGGVGLANGYLNRSDLTAERFLVNRFSKDAIGTAARMYRTGDLARWTKHGEIELLGRVDDQVKIRGHRIELGEIEAALRRQPGVREAAVAVSRLDRGEPRLIAYYVSDMAQLPTARQLREGLRQFLPDHMLPGAFVILPALPLTPNGKLDRSALLEVGETGIESGASLAPTTMTEQVVAEIFAAVLRQGTIHADDDFFELGGHSLLAAQIIRRVHRRLAVELPVRALFDHRTVAALAALIDQTRRSRSDIPPIVPLTAAERVRLWIGSDTSEDSIPDGFTPASFLQERFWSVYRDNRSAVGCAYNIPWARRLRGPIDVKALRESLATLEGRHEILRTRFHETSGRLRQIIGPPSTDLLPLLDLSTFDHASVETMTANALRQAAETPFDLERSPPWRSLLIRLNEEEHIFALVMNHILTDGWSIGVVARQLSQIYGEIVAGRGPSLHLAIQFADFAAWQRSMVTTRRAEEVIEYWRTRLAGLPQDLDLPADRRRPARRTFHGGQAVLTLPDLTYRTVTALARQTQSTTFIVTLTAVVVLLRQLSGRDDISVRTPVGQREEPGTEHLVGPFISSIVLRNRIAGDPTFISALEQVRDQTLADLAHQEIPFEVVFERVLPGRRVAEFPILQTMVVMQHVAQNALQLPGVESRALAIEIPKSHLDLYFEFVDTGEGLRAQLQYNGDIFDRSTATDFLERCVALLTHGCADPFQRISALSYPGRSTCLELAVSIAPLSVLTVPSVTAAP